MISSLNLKLSSSNIGVKTIYFILKMKRTYIMLWIILLYNMQGVRCGVPTYILKCAKLPFFRYITKITSIILKLFVHIKILITRFKI